MRPLTVAFAACVLAGVASARQGPAPQPPPRLVVHDPRLQMTVFASDPEVRTPIGIAVDARGRVFVLESHTHLQPADYPGPRGDRIRILVDGDRDGRPETITTFAEGIEDGMNIRFGPSGDLYVVSSRAVMALHDRDGDGMSEGRTRVLFMPKPQRVYDHAGLMGLAFSPDGWLYVSRGNVGGAAWTVEGTDGTAVGGYGDGGSILRCRPDGSSVQAVATGFWNPFDLQFDPAGRLLATDNDPDARGPNRLLHVIDGGDYGYKSLYGESGIHPYLSWNGELPGTLPYAAALGEAPAGMFVAARGALPADYGSDVLAAIWEERAIVRVPLAARGSTVTGRARPLMEGAEGFRPVAFAADGEGTIYVTDWVKRQYPNHGAGRIWRLTGASGVKTVPPAPEGPAGATGADPLAHVYAAAGDGGFARLREALLSNDPFMRGAAIAVLGTPRFRDRLGTAVLDPEPLVRLGAVIALSRTGSPGGEDVARRLLDDPDPAVRRMTLVWIGTAGMASLEPAIDRVLRHGAPGEEIFQTYLATLEQLSPDFIRARRTEAEPYARLLKRALPPNFVASFIADARRAADLRAFAVAYLEDAQAHVPLLASLAAAGQPAALRAEAVRSLGLLPHTAAAAALLSIAVNPSEPPALRADALTGLARQPATRVAEVLPLLGDASPDVRVAAARYLRSVRLTADERQRVSRAAAALRGDGDAPVRAQIAFASPGYTPDERTGPQWEAILSTGRGDADAGRRVFFSTPASCADCHLVERRGGSLGPDLTNVGRSKSRSQLIDAIVSPSAEISPEYQGWFVRTADGERHTGRQIDVGEGGVAQLYVFPGRFVTLRRVEEYGPMPQSLMPPGLDRALSVQDMRDLLAFLESRTRETGAGRGPVRQGDQR